MKGKKQMVETLLNRVPERDVLRAAMAIIGRKKSTSKTKAAREKRKARRAPSQESRGLKSSPADVVDKVGYRINDSCNNQNQQADRDRDRANGKDRFIELLEFRVHLFQDSHLPDLFPSPLRNHFNRSRPFAEILQ